MGDSDKLMDVESGQKDAFEEELPSDDEEGGKVRPDWYLFITSMITQRKWATGGE